MNKSMLGCLVLACSALGPVSAAERWIHLRIGEAGDKRARVDIQVPARLVSKLLPALGGCHGRGSMQVNGKTVEMEELREYWSAFRAAKDGEYLTVHDDESDVRISKSAGYLRLTADGQNSGGRLRMKIPVAFVDALVAGGNAIDTAPSGELLTVDDEDSHVRIWIDRKMTPAGDDAR